ncbi:tRNA lysidine(34) synthetase TilS [Jiangella alba]|uniref:tRNA(Ile)-lysidine synthase n=1 Tax=Jiangella alba TaxID=561176 RepID=A0A1H5PEL5_9ACTN|nr:tRNA lysidine(34) synthetase TilS [Jiangella alba]SEF12362.1 tRNA(Ile)-lysidine synthase [Jiangella alba]
MGHPHLDVRRAVRTALADLPGGSTVLVACSGGADSLSLAAATAWVATRSSGALRAGAVCVDHGLQDGSAARARAAASALVQLGLDPVVTVHLDASRGPDGPEGNARAARYTALTAAASRVGASAVLLGHTLDDQAETVLLGLARGSGSRSLSGMAACSGSLRRPLLGLRRSVVRAALPAGLVAWEDPHNEDAAYARARVRHRVLPVLEAELGPGVAEALARTAALARADADALDAAAAAAFAVMTAPPASPSASMPGVVPGGVASKALASSGSSGDRRDRTQTPPGPGGAPPYGRAPTTSADDAVAPAGAATSPPGAATSPPGAATSSAGTATLPGLDVGELAALPQAVRWRVLRRAAIAAGSPPTDLTAAHVAAVDTLVTGWRGQAGIDLPGGLRATRRDGRLRFT